MCVYLKSFLKVPNSLSKIRFNIEYSGYTATNFKHDDKHSGVSRISFRGGFNIFLKKWGYLHGAKRHAARGEATRLLGGFGGMNPRENF